MDEGIAKIRAKYPDGNDMMRDITGFAKWCFLAAEAGNWELARHNFTAVFKRLKDFANLKAHHEEAIQALIIQWGEPMSEAITAGSLSAFNVAWEGFLSATNLAHLAAKMPGLAVVSPSTDSPDMIQFRFVPSGGETE